MNIEVLGFGNKSSVDDLKNKHERDNKIKTKMRQIDKTQFSDEFSTNILLGNNNYTYSLENTFKHREQKRGDI